MSAAFHAAFIYSDEVLSDFEAMLAQKRETPLGTRVLLGVLGGAGGAWFGWKLYSEGFDLIRVGYLLVCSVMLVLAFTRRGQKDDTPARYRRHYQNRHVTFDFDEEGLEMRLEGQKNYARSKYKEVYGLFDTDKCLYIAIRGRAYYILPRDGVSDGQAGELVSFLEKKCAKKFQHYDLAKQ